VEATAAGEHLAASGVVPDYAVVSAAVRAVQTWEAVAKGSGATAEVSVDAACYNGNPDTVLEALRLAPEGADTVIFVGHNPTASYVCHLLDDGEGDPEAVGGLLRGFPPGALAVFEVSGPWADLGEESGRVVDFFPR
jgi:phosphohistidine phosphatase